MLHAMADKRAFETMLPDRGMKELDSTSCSTKAGSDSLLG